MIKKASFVWMLMPFLMTHYLYPYYKFCYVVHHYPGDTLDKLQAFRANMHNMIPFDADKAAYTFSYATNHGRVHCYVKLRSKDRKEVLRYLASYGDGTTQVKQVINNDVKREKSNSSVGLILQDFTRENPEVTIAEVEQRLLL